jgi:hypothetical protein
MLSDGRGISGVCRQALEVVAATSSGGEVRGDFIVARTGERGRPAAHLQTRDDWQSPADHGP